MHVSALIAGTVFVTFFGVVQAHYGDKEKHLIAEMWKLELVAFKEKEKK